MSILKLFVFLISSIAIIFFFIKAIFYKKELYKSTNRKSIVMLLYIIFWFLPLKMKVEDESQELFVKKANKSLMWLIITIISSGIINILLNMI